MALFRSIVTVGGWTMGSRVLGFIRDMLIANVIGAGLVADAFFIAFKFPNLFRRLFGEGAMNAAFVPLYAGKLEKEGEEGARIFGSQVAAVLASFGLLLTIAAMAFMPWIMTVQARGFMDEPEKFTLTVALARITFPYLLFMVLAAMLSGMLNTVGRFAAAAAAPILLNLVLIGAMVSIHFKVFTLPGQTLAWGVAIAGALQFLMLVLACRKAGIMVPLPLPRLTPPVKRLMVLMAPGVIGAGVVQINVLIGDMLATFLPEGSVSYLYYADRVNQLPLGVVGTAVGIALLPLLSRQLKAGNETEAMHSQNRAMEFSLVLTLPAAAALIAMPDAIIRTLFQHGAFDAQATEATAMALRAFAIGLPAYVMIKALLPGFYAREDTSTPVKIATVVVISDILIAVSLMQVIAHVGIALATASSAWINAVTLAVVLKRRGHFRLDAEFRRRIPRLLLSVALMAAALVAAKYALQPWLLGSRLEAVAALAILVAGGGSVFFVAAALTKAVTKADLSRALKRRRAS